MQKDSCEAIPNHVSSPTSEPSKSSKWSQAIWATRASKEANQPFSQLASQPTIKATNQSTNRPTNQSTNLPASQPPNHGIQEQANETNHCSEDTLLEPAKRIKSKQRKQNGLQANKGATKSIKAWQLQVSQAYSKPPSRIKLTNQIKSSRSQQREAKQSRVNRTRKAKQASEKAE